MCTECIKTVKIILFGFMPLSFDTTKLTRIYAKSCEQNQGFENHRNTEPILVYSKDDSRVRKANIGPEMVK